MEGLCRTMPAVLTGLALAMLLIAGLPQFLCMPLWADVTLYDLAARNVLQGGVHYRDIFDTNLPGMVWLHAGIRSAFGWSSEALRAVDFVVVAGIILLILRWLRAFEVGSVARLGTALLLFAYYFALSEWFHCQRDVWMLLPALAALQLRRTQLDRLSGKGSVHGLTGWAVLEGACWGSAFWIKPHVAVPALACWLSGLVLARPQKLRVLADAGGLLVGGMLVGLPGILWLWTSGSWPYFVEVFRDWNPEYLGQRVGMVPRTLYLLLRLFPWGLIHLPALVVAWSVVLRAAVQRDGFSSEVQRVQVLLAACYLGWLVQAAYIQATNYYVLAPLVFLAVPVLVGRGLPAGQPMLRRAVLIGVAAVVVLVNPILLPQRLAIWDVVVLPQRLRLGLHPVLRPERLALWRRCLMEGSTPQLRDQLALISNENTPDWQDLDRVAAYLRGLQLRDGELTCYHNAPHVLYLELGLRPSTPYLHFNTMQLIFRSRWTQLCADLNRSPQKYVVSDLMGHGLTRREVQDWAAGCGLPPGLTPEWRSVFPWTEPVVFRAGRYLIHRVAGPVRRIRPEQPAVNLGPEIDLSQSPTPR